MSKLNRRGDRTAKGAITSTRREKKLLRIKKVALELKRAGAKVTINISKYPELGNWAKKHNC